jgi:hypothetical protein
MGGAMTPYPQELKELVFRLSETHDMDAIVEIVKAKKESFSAFDRKRFCKAAGYNLVSRERRLNKGKKPKTQTARSTNGNGSRKREERKKAFECKLFLPGGVVLDLQPGQYYEVKGKTLTLKHVD